MVSPPSDRPNGLPQVLPQVLIVEDSRTMRETLRVLLSLDFDCRVAVDGADALAQALAEPPALILSDVEMLGVDGYELLAQVRARPALAQVRFVLLSGHAPRSGAPEPDLYLVKPVKPGILIERLRALLQAPRP